MAASKKIKFDSKLIFLDDQHSQADKDVFIRSPLFPVFVSAYNSTGGGIRVGLFDYNIDADAARWRINVVTPQGFIVGMIKGQANYVTGDQSYEYATVMNGLADPRGSSHTVLHTSNSRYLLNKLSAKSNHEAASYLRRYTKEAGRVVDNFIYSTVDGLIDKKFGERISRSPAVYLSPNLDTYLARVAMGEVTLNDMPMDMRTELDTKFSDYKTKREKFWQATNFVKDFIKGGKWLYINNINGGVVVAAIAADNTEKAIDGYQDGLSLAGAEAGGYAQYSIEPKWYPSHDAIPEEYRRELDYGLMMLKVHTKSEGHIPKLEMRFSTELKIWDEIGAAMCEQNGGVAMLMLQR